VATIATATSEMAVLYRDLEAAGIVDERRPRDAWRSRGKKGPRGRCAWTARRPRARLRRSKKKLRRYQALMNREDIKPASSNDAPFQPAG
jgi:hypothetical protein